MLYRCFFFLRRATIIVLLRFSSLNYPRKRGYNPYPLIAEAVVGRRVLGWGKRGWCGVRETLVVGKGVRVERGSSATRNAQRYLPGFVVRFVPRRDFAVRRSADYAMRGRERRRVEYE